MKLVLPAPLGQKVPDRSNSDAMIAHYVRRSAIAFILLFGVGGAWASLSSLSGAVIAPGFVVVDSNARSIQHPTGGVVEHIAVREGQVVAQGDLLLRLDETQTRAQLSIQQGIRTELQIRQARLDAERIDSGDMVLHEDIQRQIDDPAVARMVQLERTVLDSRRKVAKGQDQQLQERINQLNLEIQGNEEQLLSRRRQVALITTELRDLEALFARNLVPLARVSGLRREQVRMQGDIGAFVAEIAKARARIVETQLQLIQNEQQRRADLNNEGREVASKLTESRERMIVFQDMLQRIELRSPVSGTVHQLAVFTQGGVIRSGDTVMRIIPRDDILVFEARIAPRDIDQVSMGQSVSIRLQAANQQSTRSFEGVISSISPDLTLEPATQARFFQAKVQVAAAEWTKPDAPRLIPGMPADLYIRTTDRSPLSYMLRPIMEQAHRAFRER